MEDRHYKRVGAAEIAGILRRELSKGAWAAKERLPSERILAQDYGVARGTIREALNQLAEDGLVEIRRSSGTYVCADNSESTNPVIGNASPIELIDARFALEPHICRLAVLHARQRELRRAEDLLDQMEKSPDDASLFSSLDTAFHTLLAETTGNPLLIWMVSQINSVRNQDQWSRMRHLTLNEQTITQYNRQHRKILDAITAREPEEAATLMKEHLETGRLSLTRATST